MSSSGVLHARITSALQSGLIFLSKQLEENDYFVGASSDSPTTEAWQNPTTNRTTFDQSLVLSALSNFADLDAKQLQKKLAKRLVKEVASNGSLNYWFRNSFEIRHFPYPDDLDDTCCGIAALWQYNSKHVTAKHLALLTKALIACETKPGGPYRTWLTTSQESDWRDVDLGVNCNIAYCLRLLDCLPDQLRNYLQQAIQKEDLRSIYYPSQLVLCYFLARAIGNQPQPTLLRKIITTKPTNDLEVAVSLSALVQLKSVASTQVKLVKQLLSAQQQDGSWAAEIICRDPAQKGKNYFHASAAVSTALALEALNSYIQLSKPDTKQRLLNNPEHDRIVRKAQQQISSWPTEIAEPGAKLLNRITKADPKHHNTLLAHQFAKSLSADIPKSTLEKLGLGSLFGWLAYTAYDDIMDENRIDLLPLANYCHRQSLLCFKIAVPNKAFEQLVESTFNIMDAANAWELTHARKNKPLPRYDIQKLANRSLGHCLAPMGVLFATTAPSSHRAITQKVLVTHITIRQLNDDLHDWEEDYSNGRVSYVVAALLKDKPNDLPQHFWKHILPMICSEMQQLLQQSKKEIAKSPMRNNLFLNALLEHSAASIYKITKQQRDAREFLKHY